MKLRAAAAAPRSAPGTRPLAEVERAHVLAALDAHGGNQTRTAAALGIGTATLYRKLKTWATSTPG